MERVLIIGAGFAGLAAACRLALARGDVAVTVIDPRTARHFLPLLPDVVGRQCDPRRLQLPLAEAAGRWGFRHVRDQVESVDLPGHRVTGRDAAYDYDRLLIASGARSSFFGRDELAEHAFVLDSVEGAVRIRDAAAGEGPDAWVICGGGYTGVEIATSLWRHGRRHGRARRLVIVDKAAGVCPALPPWQRAYIERQLCTLGIELRVGTSVTEVGKDWVRLGTGETLPNCRLVWTAGVQAAAFVRALPLPQSREGRIDVDAYLRATEDCFAAGDAAGVKQAGKYLRAGVRFSVSEGRCAAGNILRSLRGAPLRPFRPADPGYIVPLAHNRSCGVALGVPLRGRLPTLLHYAICVALSAGAGNRVGVLRGLLAEWRAPSK